MPLRLGATAPDFTAETTEGTIHFHDWIGNKWAMLFSHPKDFTPVCTTEFGAVARLCLGSGGNSLAAISEHVKLGLIRPRGQG